MFKDCGSLPLKSYGAAKGEHFDITMINFQLPLQPWRGWGRSGMWKGKEDPSFYSHQGKSLLFIFAKGLLSWIPLKKLKRSKKGRIIRLFGKAIITPPLEPTFT